MRAVIALLWAAAIAIAVGDDVPSTGSDVPVAAAALLTAYPLIDVVASLTEVGLGMGPRTSALRINAVIGTLAAAALAATAFGSDAGAVLVVFGSWAFVSGAIQLGIAAHRRRAGAAELPMIISGGVSMIAGVAFVAASRMDDAHLSNVGAYAALGAVLYLLWALRSHRSASRAAR